MLFPPLKRDDQFSVSPSHNDSDNDSKVIFASNEKKVPNRWKFKSPHSIYQSMRASYSKIEEMKNKFRQDTSDIETVQSARNIISLVPLNTDLFNLKATNNNENIEELNIKLAKSNSTVKMKANDLGTFSSHFDNIRKNYKQKQYVFVK